MLISNIVTITGRLDNGHKSSRHLKLSLTRICSQILTLFDFGLSAGDVAHDGAVEEQSGLRVEDLLKCMVFESPSCCQLFILNSVTDIVNIPIKHPSLYPTFVTCVCTRGTAKLFASKTRFMPFLSGLQTLSVDFSLLGPNFFACQTDESHVSSGRALAA